MKPSLVVQYKKFTFDFSRCEVKTKGQCVELEPKVMSVLALLHARRGEVVSQQEIFAQVWQGRIYNQSLIQRAITLIRKALDEDAASAVLLVTYPKKGYSLTVQPSISPTKLSRVGFIAVISLLLVCIIAVFWSFYNTSKELAFTSLTPVVSKRVNEYSLSQHPSSDALLYIKKAPTKYEVWRQEKGQEIRLFSSEKPLSYVFWYSGLPAFTRLSRSHTTEFVQLNEKNTARVLNEVPTKLTSPPQTHGNNIYFSSENALWVFNVQTLQSRILHAFSEVKYIDDISYSDKRHSLAILADTGQTQHKVMELDLASLSVTDIYQGFGDYRSLNWHPNGLHLLLAQGQELALIDLDGDKRVFPFITNQSIRKAQYTLNGDAIFLQLTKLDVPLMLQEKIDSSDVITKLDYSGANLFPTSTSNVKELLFQSDFSGVQTLYLKKNQTVVKVTQAHNNEHLNGFTWASDFEAIAISKGREVIFYDPDNLKDKVKSISLAESVYVRDWYHSHNYLLVNQLDNGQSYPSKLNIENGQLELLTKFPASCAVLDANDTLYYVQNQQLLAQTFEGEPQRIHLLAEGEYSDLFVSEKFLYASVNKEGEQSVQKFSLTNFAMTQSSISNDKILAGVTQEDKLWFYGRVNYHSTLMKLD